MNQEHSNGKKNANIIARAGIRTATADLMIGIVLFAAARDLGWWPAWAYMALLVISTILPLYGPLRFDEGLLKERMSRKPDAKAWDRYFVGLVGVFTVAELVVPGFDHRWGWTKPQAIWTNLLGLALATIGTVGLMWAMRTNRFFWHS